MQSQLLEKLEEEFRSGALAETASCAYPFFLNHLEELHTFCTAYRKQFGDIELDVLLKLFLLQKNMPFDMGHYMKTQGIYIQEAIKSGNPSTLQDSQARQKAVHEWIQQFAAKHRQEAILRQIYCLEKYKGELVPKIKRALAEKGLELR